MNKIINFAPITLPCHVYRPDIDPNKQCGRPATAGIVSPIAPGMVGEGYGRWELAPICPDCAKAM